MRPSPKMILAIISILAACNSSGQKGANTLFTDLDLVTLKPVKPAISPSMQAGKNYIKTFSSRSGKKQSLEFFMAYKDSSHLSKRAKLISKSYGTVLAFVAEKGGGFEKVGFIGHRPFVYDSLLISGDTICYKENTEDWVSLYIFYPAKSDTMKIWEGYRQTRLDFLENFRFRPALRNYQNWFPDEDLHYIKLYTLVKKDSAYELISINTTYDQHYVSGFDYFEQEKERYRKGGLSTLWIALAKVILF